MHNDGNDGEDDLPDHLPTGDPAVRFVRGEEDAFHLRYRDFDAILRALHDLWWQYRRIGRLRLLADWIADRGLFDPEVGRSPIDDLSETVAALALVRDHFARRSDPGDEVDANLVALIRFLDAAEEAGLPVRAELA